MRRALALLALVLACTAVRGAPSTSGQVPTFSRPEPGLLEALLQKPFQGQGNGGRDYSGGTNGGVKITDIGRGTLPSGKAVDFAVKRQIAATTARAAMKAVAKNLIPGVGIAVALWEALEEQGVERGADGTPQMDPGQPKETRGGLMRDFRTGAPMSPAAIAAREAADAVTSNTASGVNSSGDTYNYVATVITATGSCANGSCSWSVLVRVTNNGNFSHNVGGSDSGTEISSTVCPEAQSSIPVRGSGPCKSDERVPAPPNVVDEAADDIPPDDLPDIIKGVDAAGHPGIQTDPPVIEGPETVPDGTVVRTRPDGGIETTRQEWKLEYPGWPTVTFQPRVIEGAPGDETITEGELPGTSQPEAQTDCDKYPDSIGCAEFGEPDDAELDRRTIDIDLNSDSLGDGSCPESPSFQALGQTYTIDLARLCSAGSTYVKPLVVLIAGLVAGLIFVGGLKS